ncbi:MAG: hypothetical protein RH917_09635 [Lacipirellulaceae bacterium]
MKIAVLGLACMLLAQQDGCAPVDDVKKAAEYKRQADEAIAAARKAEAEARQAAETAKNELNSEREALRRLYTED